MLTDKEICDLRDEIQLTVIQMIQARLDPNLSIDECVEQTDEIMDFIKEQM
jgi:hypothetical protein